MRAWWTFGAIVVAACGSGRPVIDPAPLAYHCTDPTMQCPPPYVCTQINEPSGNPPYYCRLPCTDDNDCPDGFSCLLVRGYCIGPGAPNLAPDPDQDAAAAPSTPAAAIIVNTSSASSVRP